MNEGRLLNSEFSILAIVVLYQRAPSESEAFSSLIRILNADSEAAKFFSLILYDNSPQPHHQERSVGFPFSYKHDPSNGGLVPAYNHALRRAEEMGSQWLLLLDQDTVLTLEFLEELIACAKALQTRPEIASIVP